MLSVLRSLVSKAIYFSISVFAGFVLLVAFLSVIAPTASADMPFPNCTDASLPYCCPPGYVANNSGQCFVPDPSTVPGSGGGGFPPQCTADAMQLYYWGEALIGYVDPDWFYEQFGCYPY
jgi:hypothetical protein